MTEVTREALRSAREQAEETLDQPLSVRPGADDGRVTGCTGAAGTEILDRTVEEYTRRVPPPAPPWARRAFDGGTPYERNP